MRIKQNKHGKTLPRAGKIKVGVKTERGFGSIDYFRAHGKYERYFHNVYGEKPKEIRLQFLSDDLESVCNERFQIRTPQGKLFAWGDGENFTYIHPKTFQKVQISPTDVEGFKEKCVEACTNQNITGKWEEVLTMRFVLPKVPVMGLWEFKTKGKLSTIRNLVSSFDTCQAAAGGSVLRIDFRLIVEMHISDKADRRKYPVVSLFPMISGEGLDLIKQIPNRQSGNLLMPFSNDDIKLLGNG